MSPRCSNREVTGYHDGSGFGAPEEENLADVDVKTENTE